jgi:periplasmic divalent cation tolerance protein
MIRVVISNCAPEESGRLARALVSEGLAACVNILPGTRSVYRWEGELCDDAEHTLMIKCAAERYEEMARRLRELHSYDVPEIVALEPTDVLGDYADWVRDVSGAPDDSRREA